MTLYEYIEVALETGHRLDAQWALFITVHLGLFGAILYVRRTPSMVERIGGIILYAVFGFFSLRLTLSLRDLLQRTAETIQANQTTTSPDIVAAYFADLSNSGHFAQARVTIIAVHLAAFALVAMTLLFARRPRAPTPPTP